MGYPLCRVCKAGDLVPVSDYSDGGASIVFKGWVCTNEACTASIMLRKGQIFRAQVETLPEPEQPAKGSTWQAWQRGTGPDGARP